MGTSEKGRAALAGAGVMAAVLAVQYVGRFTLGTILWPEAMAQALFAVVPMGMREWFLHWLGHGAKWVAFAAMHGVLLAAGAAAGLAWHGGRRWARRTAGERAARPGTGRSGGQARAVRGPAAPGDPDRRRLLQAVLAWAAGALGWAWWSRLARAAASAGQDLFARVRGLTPEITPAAQFYRVSKNLFDPVVEAADWRLQIDGLVERPYTLTYEQLRQLPAVERVVTLACISNEVGGDLISTARWRGVPLKTLVERAGLREGVVDIGLEAADDYTDSIPLAKALHPDTLVVWEMNGQPLPPEHGFPARLIVPGIYGMKNVKWLTRITAVAEDVLGFWERRGWSDQAVVKTMSRIDVPLAGSRLRDETIVVAGIAFAGDRGIRRVEVSVDGGRTWTPAQLKRPLSPYSWVHWAVAWRPTAAGRYTLTVRAVDGRGEVQTAQRSPTAPDGASGWHTIEVRVDRPRRR